MEILSKESYEGCLENLKKEENYSEVDKEADPAACTASKVKHLKENDQESLVNELKDTNVTAWYIKDPSQAMVPVLNGFKLTDETPINSRASALALKHNAVVRKEVEALLKASFFYETEACMVFSGVHRNIEGRKA